MPSPETSWIWLEHPFDLREVYARFRRRFRLDTKPKKALLSISGDSRYRLYVNNRYVGFGPARSWPERQCLDKIDVAPFLRKGANLLAVQVYQPGYSHFSYVHRGAGGLYARLRVGKKTVVATGPDWKASPDPSYASEVRRISIYGAGQEIRDLRQEDDWTRPAFEDSNWASAQVVAIEGQPPWLEFQEGSLPLLEERLIKPRLLGRDEAKASYFSDPHAIVLDASKNILEESRIDPYKSRPLKEGRATLLYFGLDRSRIGSARLVIDGARGGERILVSYLEKRRDGRWIVSDPEDYCRVRMTDAYTLRRGRNVCEGFSPRGGRYLLVTVLGPSRASLNIEVRFRARDYPLKWKPTPTLPDRELERVASACRNTIASCLEDGVVDCPWRERAQWTGDGILVGTLVAELAGDVQPLRRVLELAGQGAAPDGILPGVAPSEAHAYVVLDYNFAWVEGLYDYLRLSGDRDFVRDWWSKLTVMLSRFKEDLGKDGLLRAHSGKRLFLDWADLSKSQPNCFFNLRYLYALQIAAKLAGTLRKNDDRKRWLAQAGELERAITKHFFRKGCWYDTLDSEDRSQHVAAFLALTGLLEATTARDLLTEAVETSLEERGSRLILSSPYIHYYLFLALRKFGLEDDIRRIVKHRWGRWVQEGSPTTWENWSVNFPDGSECHAWSAHPLFFIQRNR